MSASDTTLHLIGLTETGKTNFLVALDIILDHPCDENGLVHSGSADDRSYLAPLREAWLRGGVFERTKRHTPPPPHQLLVKHQPTGKEISFNLPDLAGETIESFFVTRTMPQGLWDRLKKAEAILLFVHSNHNADHAILDDPAFIEPESKPPGAVPIPEADPDWKLEDAAMQVKLVDLLQFIAEGIPEKRQLRVAVILSAWDLVEKAHQTSPGIAAELPNHPGNFLSRRWPLLQQFLESNDDLFCYRVFGASARGGGNKQEDIERLTSIDQPSDRVILVDDAHRSTDLTRPVRWLLGLSDPSPSSNA